MGRFVNNLVADLESWRPADDNNVSPATSAGRQCGGPENQNHGQNVVPSDDTSAMAARMAVSKAASDVSDAGARTGAGVPAATPTAGCGSGLVLGAKRCAERQNTTSAPSSIMRSVAEGAGALEKLWVRDGDGRRVLFADVSVYTR